MTSSDGSCSDYEDYDGSSDSDYNDYFEEVGDSNSRASDDKGEPDGTHLFHRLDSTLPLTKVQVNPDTTKNVLL